MADTADTRRAGGTTGTAPDDGTPRTDGGSQDGPPTDHRTEYRTAELARKAGITVRTLRFYRERKLLPPPRREGRIAWYDEHHLARLRTISALLARGHTLGGIADLIAAFEKSQDAGGAAELLGLRSALAPSWSEETPVRLTPEELARHFPGEVTSENLADAVDLGYIAVEGDEVVHVSRRLFEASTALVREGIPLAAVLDAGRGVRAHADAIADLFARLVRTHLFSDVRTLSPADLERLTAVMDRLRPLSKQVVDAELALAMDRRVHTELEAWSRQDPDGTTDPDPDTGTTRTDPGPEPAGP